MKSLKCEKCGNTFPMNEMYKASNSNFCKDCVEKALQDPENPLEGTIEYQIDPTVCAKCGNDFGSTLLEKVANIPVCRQCGDFLKNRPFPNWIKYSSVALIMLVIFSLSWNWRFIQAYQEMKISYSCLGNGDIENASINMSLASKRVPESQDLHILSLYMEGRFLLWQDKSEEALEKLKLCVNKLPSGYGVDDIILQAKLGAAFDNKNYDEFLSCAKSIEKKYPDDFMSKATLASAYACKYVEMGEQKYRDQALSSLDMSRKLANGNAQFKEYENRILYRIHSRKIITTEEFNKQFPSGWENPSDI